MPFTSSVLLVDYIILCLIRSDWCFYAASCLLTSCYSPMLSLSCSGLPGMLWILFSLLQPKSIFIFHSSCFDSTSEKVPFLHPSSLAPWYIAKLVCAFCGLSLLIQQQKFSFEFQIIKTSLVSFFPWLHKLLEAVLHFLIKMHFKKNQCFYRM